jgi:hypothetical protein
MMPTQPVPSKEVIVKVSAPTPARRSPFLVAVASAALLSGWCGTCLAQEDDSLPLFLTSSLTLMHDSNLARTTERQSDTVRSLGVAAGLNKAYGRQTYLLYGRLTKNQYNRFADQLDNDSKNLNGKFTSEFLSNWLVTLGGQYDENLNSLQDNSLQERVIKNVRTYRDTNLSLQYGKSGLWSIVGKIDQNDLTYSRQRLQNAEQNSQSVRVYYSPSDLLRFGVGPRFVKTDYPYRTISKKVEDKNLDFTADWRATGLSSLNALLSLRDTKYTDASGQSTNNDSVTGSLGWFYTPRGPISYTANLSRKTNSDRYNSGLLGLGSVSMDYITNTVALGARWQATAKISLGANYTRNMYDNSRTIKYSLAQLSTLNSTSSTESHQDTYSLDLQYQPTRSVELSCNVSKYSQTLDIMRNEYDGHVTSCSASLTLD